MTAQSPKSTQCCGCDGFLTLLSAKRSLQNNEGLVQLESCASCVCLVLSFRLCTSKTGIVCVTTCPFYSVSFSREWFHRNVVRTAPTSAAQLLNLVGATPLSQFHAMRKQLPNICHLSMTIRTRFRNLLLKCRFQYCRGWRGRNLWGQPKRNPPLVRRKSL